MYQLDEGISLNDQEVSLPVQVLMDKSFSSLDGVVTYQVNKSQAEEALSSFLKESWEFEDVNVYDVFVELYVDRKFFISFRVYDGEDDYRERDNTDFFMIEEIISCLGEVYDIPVLDFRINDKENVVYLFVRPSTQ